MGPDVDEYVTDLSGVFHKVNPIQTAPSGSSLKITTSLGEAIGSGFLIYISGANAFKYSQNNLSLYDSIVGITNQSGNTGDVVEVILNGMCNQVGGLTPGTQYYASNSGLLVSSIPVTGIVQPVGVAITASSISINLQKPYIKI